MQSSTTLNWKEIALLTENLRPQISGLHVDRIIVPERTSFPTGYLKGEWAIRMNGKQNDGVLMISVRPRHPYLYFQKGKGPKAATQGTRSPFDLFLSKSLKGAKLLDCTAIEKERVVIFWFSDPENPRKYLGLVLVLIPATPEALLIKSDRIDTQTVDGWPILARSKKASATPSDAGVYIPPNGERAPENPPIKNHLIENIENFSRQISQELEKEAFQIRLQAAEKALDHLVKHAQERLKQSAQTLRETKSEPDWQNWANLMKSTLHTPAKREGNLWLIHDYASDSVIQIPIDPKYGFQEQMDRYYHLARRNQRRLIETQTRVEQFQATLKRLKEVLENEKPNPLDWGALEKWERAAGNSFQPSQANGTGKPEKKSGLKWLGKTFYSKDRMTILVGRSRDENLELTFRHARGNDLWLHVRGKPGSHVVVPLPPNKSAPLETLLDAAHLAIYYSGGEKWGKTEVDYTYKKYVKRIKNSTEASYTNNKTLIIDLDAGRLKRLLSET